MSPLRRRQNVAFGTIWLAYCITYFLRKPLGIVKPELGARMHLSHTQLGYLDMSLLLPYAAVQILCSSRWDRSVPRQVIVVCLSLSSLSMLAFCGSQWYFMVCMCLFVNGAAQAPIWPACTKVLSAWYPENRISSVFGAISTAPYAGALVGTAMAIYLQDHYHWRLVFVPAGIMGLVVSVFVHFVLKTPKELNMEVPGEIKTASSPQKTSSSSESSFAQIWSIPAVPEVTVAVFCLKFVRYCMYMWLPMYLIEHLGYDKVEGGLFSTMFDIGGILGGPILGVGVDRFYHARPLWGIYHMTMLGTITFVLVALISHWGSVYLSVLLLLAGAANCGPDSLLAGSVTMLIGEKFGKGMGAGVTSFVNGVGSLGAIVEGPVIGMVSQYVGWMGVIVCMVVLSLMTTLATLKAQLVVSAEERKVRKEEEIQQQQLV